MTETQKMKPWELALIVFVVGALVLIVGAVMSAPHIHVHTRRCSDYSAIGALKTISTAQSLYRESDRERDGNLDYGTLSELATAGTTG